MCGIAGIYIKDSATKVFEKQGDIELLTDALLAGIEIRGRDATGVVSVAIGSTVPVLEKADIQASRFMHWRSPIAHNPRMVLIHTRFATKGHPTNLNNNHPVQYGTTFVTHNGVIMNDDELFEKHGFERIAQVDTEIIPALLDKHGLDKANVALKELDGSYAIAACDPVNAPGHLLLAKGPSSPLEYMETDEVIVWASSKNAIENAWLVTTGKKPAWNDINTLRYSGLLLIGPKTVEKFDFPVFEKAYTRTSNYGYGYGEYGETTWKRESCVCGDSKTMHSGSNDEGSCLRHNCNCVGFINDTSPTGKAHPLRDVCRKGHLTLLREEDDSKSNGWNQREYTVKESGETTVWAICVGCSEPVKIDEMTAMFGYWFCDECAVEGEDEEEEEVTEDDNFDLAILETASELSLKAEYVHWLLFKAVDADFDKDINLVSAYCACDDVYTRCVEAFIGKGVSDIDKNVPVGL